MLSHCMTGFRWLIVRNWYVKHWYGIELKWYRADDNKDTLTFEMHSITYSLF